MLYKAAYIKTFFDNMVLPYVVPDGMEVKEGGWYLVNSKFGEDIGRAETAVIEVAKDKFHVKKPQGGAHHHKEDDAAGIEIDDKSILETKDEHIPEDNQLLDTLKLIRPVTNDEADVWHAYRPEEKKAYEAAKKEIKDLALDMKLVNVHFLFQRKKIIFNFTADNRIDFRQLVKRLAGLFRTRIEMRQIGVRDAAKVLGGYGVCGVQNCCQRSNCHINSIYLKMAKDQGFMVNSSKLTGSCGRLMCCLSYEMEFYSQEKKLYPEQGSRVNDGSKDYVVSSINMIKREVYVMDENHHQKKFPVDSLKFLRKEGPVAFYKADVPQNGNGAVPGFDDFGRPIAPVPGPAQPQQPRPQQPFQPHQQHQRPPQRPHHPNQRPQQHQQHQRPPQHQQNQNQQQRQQNQQPRPPQQQPQQRPDNANRKP